MISLVAVLVGCGDTDPTAEANPASPGPVPVSSDSLVGAGEPIADGFVVPDETVLAGAPLPVGPTHTTNGEESVDKGWVAYLIVPGDPRDVVDQLRSQAQGNGLLLQPVVAYQSPTGSSDSFCQADGSNYDCLAFASSEDPNDTRSLLVEFHRRPAAGTTSAQTQMRVTYSNAAHPLLSRDFFASVGPSDSPLGPEPPPVPTAWAPLPGPGERFEGDLYGFDLVPNSELVMPPTLGSVTECHTTSFTALLSTDKDPTAAVQAYIDQVTGPDSDAEPIGRTYDGVNGSRLTVRAVNWLGGGGYTFGLIERADKPALIHITTCFS